MATLLRDNDPFIAAEAARAVHDAEINDAFLALATGKLKEYRAEAQRRARATAEETRRQSEAAIQRAAEEAP